MTIPQGSSHRAHTTAGRAAARLAVRMGSPFAQKRATERLRRAYTPTHFYLELCKELPDQACAPLAASVHADIHCERLAFTPCTWTVSHIPEEKWLQVWGFWGFGAAGSSPAGPLHIRVPLGTLTGGAWRRPQQFHDPQLTCAPCAEHCLMKYIRRERCFPAFPPADPQPASRSTAHSGART